MSLNTSVAIVGAGPAGLSAGIEIAKRGGKLIIFDENDRPGGQLFKQIHKFFGSENHGAGIRGFRFGEKLTNECQSLGVDIRLNSIVHGVFPGNELGVITDGRGYGVKAEKILFATGATEKPLPFPGWDLPGVMGAGAAQTMININRVKPGKRALMIGSGNVGLVVSYQLLQAGIDVVGLVEALPRVNGYKVHADKLMRQGVPIYTSHTILEARGLTGVKTAVIAELGPNFKAIEGTEKELEVDLVCMAVGLQPALELVRMSNVELAHIPSLGGYLPVHNKNMRTNNPSIYVAGDLAGIEEASSAMEEGKLAGIAICEDLGLISEEEALNIKQELYDKIDELRKGSHGDKRRLAKAKLIGRCASWIE